MPKYRNKTEFTRPVNVTGRRLAIKPNDVISSDIDLDLSIYDFLEKVDDSQKTSSVKQLGQKIEVVKPEEIKKVQTQVDALKDIPEDMKTVLKRMEIIKNALETLNKENANMKALVESVATENKTLTTTVGSLKTVIKDLEKEVYDNGLIVIEDDEKENT